MDKPSRVIASGVPVLSSGLYGDATTNHLAAMSDEAGANDWCFVWIGTFLDGTTVNLLGISYPLVGDLSLVLMDSRWTDGGIEGSPGTAHIYGISGVLTVPISYAGTGQYGDDEFGSSDPALGRKVSAATKSIGL